MFILLNGPPGCGKDTVAELVGGTHRSFKTELYDIAIMASGVARDIAMLLFTDRELKEARSPYFTVGGLAVSPRDYLIHVSENLVKPLLGDDYFGKALYQSSTNDDVTVVSDSGFVEEARALAGRKVIVVPIYRKDCSFDNDSRDYLPEDPNYTITEPVYNNGTIEEFTNKIKEIICTNY